MCMCEQDTWSLRLLLLGGSWGKSPSTGEILCCWAGLNFTSLSAPDWTDKWHIILWTRLDCAAWLLDVNIQCALVCPPLVAQMHRAGAAAAKHRDLMYSQQPHPTDPGYGAVETLL